MKITWETEANAQIGSKYPVCKKEKEKKEEIFVETEVGIVAIV